MYDTFLFTSRDVAYSIILIMCVYLSVVVASMFSLVGNQNNFFLHLATFH